MSKSNWTIETRFRILEEDKTVAKARYVLEHGGHTAVVVRGHNADQPTHFVLRAADLEWSRKDSDEDDEDLKADDEDLKADDLPLKEFISARAMQPSPTIRVDLSGSSGAPAKDARFLLSRAPRGFVFAEPRGSELAIVIPGAPGEHGAVRGQPSQVEWDDLLRNIQKATRAGELADAAKPTVERTANGDDDPEPTLYWNTFFPEDAAVNRNGYIVPGIPYLLRTQLALTPLDVEFRDVFPMAVDFEGPVDVGFRVEAVNAILAVKNDAGRPNGEDFSDEIHSQRMRCTPESGSPPFDLWLQALEPKAVELALTLLVNGNDYKTDIVQLIASGPGASVGASGHVAVPASQGREIALRHLHEVPCVAVGMTFKKKSNRLEFAWGGWREARDPVEFGEIPASELVTHRKPLNDLANDYTGDFGSQLNPEPRDKAGTWSPLLTFARTGFDMHSRLFNGGVANALIADKLRALGRSAGKAAPVVQINAPDLPLPWGVLYDGEWPEHEKQVRPEGFWGYRFQIHRVVRSTLSQAGWKESGLDRGQALQLQACICEQPFPSDPLLNQALSKHQTKLFQDYLNAPQSLDPITTKDSFKAFVTGKQNAAGRGGGRFNRNCNVLYFFCHGHAAQTISPAYTYTDALRDIQAGLTLDQTITVKEMRRLSKTPPWAEQPLVILNACASTLGDVAYQSPLLSQFAGFWQACGVVGTDVPVPAVFAAHFSERVFEKLFGVEKLPLGRAFNQVTRECIDEYRNPFGLIYAIYAPLQLRVRK